MPKLHEHLSDRDVDRLDEKRFMRRTIPRLPNFLTQVLYAIQTIRCKRGRGATLGEICCFMRNNFGITGDVRSRVDTTIAQAKCDGFCIGKGGKYVLITPLARMQNARTREERHTIIKHMQTIFLYKPNMNKRQCHSPLDVKENRNAPTAKVSRRKTAISRSEIVSVLKHIESVLIKHLVRDDDEVVCNPIRTPDRPATQPARESNLKKSDLHINKLLIAQSTGCKRRRTADYYGSNYKRRKHGRRSSHGSRESDYSKDSSNSDCPPRSKYLLRSKRFDK